MLSDNLIEYELFDISGKVFNVRVTRNEAAALDLDHKQRFRFIEKLKKIAQPSSEWGELSVIEPEPSANVSSLEPLAGAGSSKCAEAPKGAIEVGFTASSPLPVPRATGKKGAKWTNESTSALLRLLRETDRSRLRQRVTPIEIWEEMSDRLFQIQLDYSKEQIAEKVRNMKHTFSECKKGKNSGSKWKFYESMEFLYDDSIENPAMFRMESLSPIQYQQKDIVVNKHSEQGHKSGYLDRFCSNIFGDPSLGSADSSEDKTLAHNLHSLVVHDVVQPLNDIEEQGYVTVHQFEEPLDDIEEQEIASVHEVVEPLDNIDEGNITVHELVKQRNVTILNVITEHINDVEEQQNATVLNVVEKDCNDNFLRSPSRTKQKLNNGHAPNSPRKTPQKKAQRRLATNTELVWPPQLVQVFLGECVKLKRRLQNEDVSLSTWKDLSSAMDEAGHAVSWQNCKAKFTSMYLFFTGTLLLTGGKLGGVMCPYWHLMCDIHDIPLDYVMPAEGVGEATLVQGNRIWTREAIELLIQLYKTKQPLFNGTQSHVKHDIIYRDMAETMTHFTYNFTGKQCKAKFNELKTLFKKEYDGVKKTGAAPSSWEWYAPMENIFGGTATLDPPFLFTGGNYEVRGVPSGSQAALTGTRTRVSSVHEPVKEHQGRGRPKESGKKPIYKSRILEVQERQMQQRDEFIDEMRLSRQLQEKQLAEQNELLRMLIEKRSN